MAPKTKTPRCLGVSKTCDCVNHGKLLKKKMSEAGVFKYIIRIISNWYAHQTMQVKWDDCVSPPFHVNNIVKEDVSPITFNFYINSLSKKLKMRKTGCMVGGTVVNHLMYADDCVLLSPSSAVLQQLLNVCSRYREVHEIITMTLKVLL